MCHLDTAEGRILKDSGRFLVKMPGVLGLRREEIPASAILVQSLHMREREREREWLASTCLHFIHQRGIRSGKHAKTANRLLVPH